MGAGECLFMGEKRRPANRQGERMRRIGVLAGQAEGDLDAQARLNGFRQGLQRLGWSEGRNLHVDYFDAHVRRRSASGRRVCDDIP